MTQFFPMPLSPVPSPYKQPSLHCMTAVPLPPVPLLLIDTYGLSAHTVVCIFYPIPIHNSPVCLQDSEKCRHSIKTHRSLSSSYVGTIPQFFTHSPSVQSRPQSSVKFSLNFTFLQTQFCNDFANVKNVFQFTSDNHWNATPGFKRK